MNNLYALVMAGGKGTRFWPVSTEKRPKQYLSLLGRPLLAKTLTRLDSLVPAERRYIVTTREQEPMARECSQGLMADQGLIFEPEGRNTAPCILMALAHFDKVRIPHDAVIAILPSDHAILNEDHFRTTLEKAAKLAIQTKGIVTIGITPNSPHTGYGYIQAGQKQGEGHQVTAFKEKPDQATAQKYLSSGNFFWNAGMFVGQIQTFMEEYKQHAPESYQQLEKIKLALHNKDALKEVYSKLQAISFDYAIMEKSKRIYLLPASFDWNDLGSWDALEHVIKPVDGNYLAERRAFHAINATGNVVYSPGKFVSLIGVNDLVVVSTEDALLVVSKKEAQRVKDVVTWLGEQKDLRFLL
jgi:mannose-1-phosphate guanylyltransferase